MKMQLIIIAHPLKRNVIISSVSAGKLNVLASMPLNDRTAKAVFSLQNKMKHLFQENTDQGVTPIQD